MPIENNPEIEDSSDEEQIERYSFDAFDAALLLLQCHQLARPPNGGRRLVASLARSGVALIIFSRLLVTPLFLQLGENDPE